MLDTHPAADIGAPLRNEWQGKLWRMWQVACYDAYCHVEEMVGSHLWHPTSAEAARHFRSQGWRQRGGQWYCPRHARRRPPRSSTL